MERIRADVLVIGAGSGGLSVAAGAVQMGASVILLEGGEMGGDCLNFGCVPSKALLAAAKAAHGQAVSGVFGVAPVTPQVDYAAVMEHVGGVIARIAPVDSQERFEGLGVRVIREFGRFVSPTEVEAGPYRITARRIVVASGSRPFIPPIPGLDGVPFMTNETLFDLREKPGHLLIIGGGPIGMEMAQAHVRLGCKVTVIEGARALGKDDPDLAAEVVATLRQEGVHLIEETQVVAAEQYPGGIRLTLGGGGVLEGSHLLVAVGRKAVTDGLDLDVAGIATTKTGIDVDAGLRSSNRRVYAIGDVAGGMQFTHVAGYHAGVVIRSMLFGLPSKSATAHIPWVTYTDPEMAQVGMTESLARAKHGDRLEVAHFEYAHVDRAVAERRDKGRIKVMVVAGRPVGVSIVGPQAGEAIALWSLAISARLKMSAIAGMVAPYPTLSEINKRAAGAYFSPRLFDNALVKKTVGLVQRWLP